MRLSGKTALVTGGTSGIGRATAEAFAREGAEVIVSGRDEQRGAEVVAAITESGGSARFVRADLAAPASVQELARLVRGGDLQRIVQDGSQARLARGDHKVA